MEHSNYPHEAGRLHGCLACDLTCNCDREAVDAGRETECVWLGHDNGRDLNMLTNDELNALLEEAAQLEAEAATSLEVIDEVRASRGLRRYVVDADDDG